MYTGLTGKLEIALEENGTFGTSTEVAYISNWSVEDTTDIIEVTKLGKEYKEKQPGLQSWSASADGTVVFDGNSQIALFKAKHDGTLVQCAFYLDTGVVFTGNGYIESLSVDLSAEDKGNISISISGDGGLIYPNA